jgi:uncharacterized small protein (TIGR04563 family)
MSDKVEQPLYFPEDMLRQIQAEATRTDRSMSSILQLAYNTAREQIAPMDHAALSAAKGSYGGDKRKQTLYFPDDMLADMRAVAGRLDVSLSLVAQAAFSLARDAIAALPADAGEPQLR